MKEKRIKNRKFFVVSWILTKKHICRTDSREYRIDKKKVQALIKKISISNTSIKGVLYFSENKKY